MSSPSPRAGRRSSRSAPRPRRCSRRSPTASAADVDRAVAAARRAYNGAWGRMSGADRGKYLFRIARILQERAREFAVLESLDNGKPIKESRDVDVPLAAAHFFYHAGWADKLEYAGLGTNPRPHGVVGQVIPWNFPLLMLAWKIAPALATGNTVVLKPAETTPLTALLFAEVVPAGRPAAGRGQHRHRRRRDRPGHRRPPRHRQARVHRLDRRRQDDRPLDRRHPQEGHPRARRQGRQHRLRRRRRSTRRSRASSTASSSTRATSAAPGSRLLVQENIADEVEQAPQAPPRDPARRRPARQEHRRGRHQLQGPARSGSPS